MQPGAVLLFEDETILRLFALLRKSWSLQGEQAKVGVTGRNAQQVLFGVINLHTAHRIIMQHSKMRQDSFQAFLHLLRRRYHRKTIWLLLDKGGLHTATKSLVLAEELNIKLIWLPKQCPELNGMDQLWRSIKAEISANYQFPTIDEHAGFAKSYIMKLTNRQALRRAGILSKSFWLGKYL